VPDLDVREINPRILSALAKLVPCGDATAKSLDGALAGHDLGNGGGLTAGPGILHRVAPQLARPTPFFNRSSSKISAPRVISRGNSITSRNRLKSNFWL
jgi:hypothetical protein